MFEPTLQKPCLRIPHQPLAGTWQFAVKVQGPAPPKLGVGTGWSRGLITLMRFTASGKKGSPTTTEMRTVWNSTTMAGMMADVLQKTPGSVRSPRLPAQTSEGCCLHHPTSPRPAQLPAAAQLEGPSGPCGSPGAPDSPATFTVLFFVALCSHHGDG